MCVDTAGRLYVATNLGIQICDQAGRVNCIVPLPAGAVTAVSLGDRNTLFARSGDKVFRRKVQAEGVDSTQAPIKPAAPRL